MGNGNGIFWEVGDAGSARGLSKKMYSSTFRDFSLSAHVDHSVRYTYPSIKDILTAILASVGISSFPASLVVAGKHSPSHNSGSVAALYIRLFAIQL